MKLIDRAIKHLQEYEGDDLQFLDGVKWAEQQKELKEGEKVIKLMTENKRLSTRLERFRDVSDEEIMETLRRNRDMYYSDMDVHNVRTILNHLNTKP